MRQYRIYYIDHHNHITGADDFEGPDDLSALERANQLREKRTAEIWESVRLVARITPEGEAGHAA